jgi:AraC-like DNA-binding protein
VSQINAHLSQIRAFDPDYLMGAIRGCELEPWLINGHGKPSELSRILLPNSCLDMAEVGPSMLFRGVSPKDHYTMIFVRACPTVGHAFHLNTSHHDDAVAFLSPGHSLDSMTPQGYKNATLTIPAAIFEQSIAWQDPQLLKNIDKRGGAIFPDLAKCQSAQRLFRSTIETIRHQPETLESESARQSLESELHEQFYELVRHDDDDQNRTTFQRRYARLKLVRDFIHEHCHRRMQLQELCAVSGLSRRGLEYLFIDLLGVRVTTFLLRSRLQGVRRELLAAEPQHGVVKQCALHWGFWHLGRFAAEYHSLFGEHPTATVSRRKSRDH